MTIEQLKQGQTLQDQREKLIKDKNTLEIARKSPKSARLQVGDDYFAMSGTQATSILDDLLKQVNWNIQEVDRKFAAL